MSLDPLKVSFCGDIDFLSRSSEEFCVFLEDDAATQDFLLMLSEDLDFLDPSLCLSESSKCGLTSDLADIALGFFGEVEGVRLPEEAKLVE